MTNPYPFHVGKLPAEDLNDAIDLSRAIIAIKSADETVNNSASPQNDDELTVEYDTGQDYILLSWLVWTGVDQTADFRQDFATSPGTTGATVSTSFFAQPTTATASTGSLDTGAILDSPASNSSDHTRGTINGTLAGFLIGTLWGGSAAGTLVLRWAQGTAGATNLVLERGSWLCLIPMTS